MKRATRSDGGPPPTAFGECGGAVDGGSVCVGGGGGGALGGDWHGRRLAINEDGPRRSAPRVGGGSGPECP